MSSLMHRLSRSLCVGLLLVLAACLWAPASHAANDALLKRGLKNYKDLEFAKARNDLETYLRQPNLPKADKVNALRHLVICYYNEGQKSQAKDVWKQTLKIDRNATIPAGQSPDVQRFFATVKPPPLPRRQAPPRRIKATPVAPQGGFRHTGSVITLGVGAVAAGVAVAFGVMAQGSAAQAAQQDTTTAAIEQQSAAQTNASVATGLWIGSGVALATGVVLLIVEATRKPAAPPTASLPHLSPKRVLLQTQLP